LPTLDQLGFRNSYRNLYRSQWKKMQIAGNVKVSKPVTGFTRVEGIPFKPSPKDVDVYVLAPPGWHGPTIEAFNEVAAMGAKLDVEAVSGRIHGRPSKTDVFLRWGYAGPYEVPGPKLNFGGGVSRSSSNTASLKALKELAPPSWDNFYDLVTGSTVIGKQDHGMHGRGKKVLVVGRRPVTPYAIYQKYIPRRIEWRIHVFKDAIISAMRKEPNNTDLTKFRDGFDFKRVQVIPKAVGQMAIEAAKRVGLDFAGVDLMKDEDTGAFYVLETNSAPGMEPQTIKRLYMHIQRLYSKQ